MRLSRFAVTCMAARQHSSLRCFAFTTVTLAGWISTSVSQAAVINVLSVDQQLSAIAGDDSRSVANTGPPVTSPAADADQSFSSPWAVASAQAQSPPPRNATGTLL